MQISVDIQKFYNLFDENYPSKSLEVVLQIMRNNGVSFGLCRLIVYHRLKLNNIKVADYLIFSSGAWADVKDQIDRDGEYLSKFMDENFDKIKRLLEDDRSQNEEN